MVQVEISRPASFAGIRWRRRIRVTMPAGWNELNGCQAIRAALALFTVPDPAQRKLQLLLALLGVSWRRLAGADPAQLAYLATYTDFLQTKNELTKNPLPVITLGWRRRRFYGPDDGFANLRVNEFIYAETFFDHFHRTKDQAALTMLAAILYRPQRQGYDPTSPSYEGDRRQDFNTNLLAGRQQQLASLGLGHKLAIYLYYSGNRYLLAKQFPNCFSGSEENKKVSQPWLTMVRGMPSDKFGTIEAIEKLLLKTVLFHVDGLIQEAQEQAAEAKRTSRP